MNTITDLRQGDATATADFTVAGSLPWERQPWPWPLPSLPSAVNEPPPFVDYATDTTGAASPMAYIQLFLQINGLFRQAISAAKGDQFFDGMTSPLAEATRNIIAANGAIAVESLRQVLNIQHNEVASTEEILRQIGLIEDAATHPARLKLLADMLASAQEQIRDAALLGLSFLEDAAALPYLRQALQRESAPWLSENLKTVIAQLEQI